MISEFQELSDKIDQLAELTASLRRENASLRQANAALMDEKAAHLALLHEAQSRVAALIHKIPPSQASAMITSEDEAAQ